MAPLASNGIPAPYQHQRAKSDSETQCEEARVIFDKTIAGHYRYGKTGYRNVGALFLTWADDDMQCKDAEVVTFTRPISRKNAHLDYTGD